ncbi:hypothetical protein K1719_016661 [Acacia pycnantha]|nr:hypothetical protein K1719_016661 [Acacia pycnantha]
MWNGNELNGYKRCVFRSLSPYCYSLRPSISRLCLWNRSLLACGSRGDTSSQNGFNGNGRIGRDDLRLKLMRKSASRLVTRMVGNEQQTPQTVDALLHALGLGKYVIPFKAEEYSRHFLYSSLLNHWVLKTWFGEWFVYVLYF